MRVSAVCRRIGIIAVLLGVAGSATAQQVPVSPSGQVGFERRAALSPQDEVAQADIVITRMDRTSSTIRGQLDAARQGRDVVRSLCLSDKLSQVDVAARSARDRQAALQSAAQRNDTELSNHEYTILTVLRQRAEQLSAEANQCIGEDVAFVGTTNVVTSYDPNMVNVDPSSETPPEPGVVVAPPQCVSCTQ